MTNSVSLREKKLRFVLFLVAILISVKAAAAVPYQKGDVFAGTGDGKIDVYSSTGVFIQTLDTTSGSTEQTGMCFDATGNLYATSFTDRSMSKFDNAGTLLVYPWGGPFSVRPESCVVDKSGNIYTGEVDGDEKIRKFDTAGTLLGEWSPATERRGLDWIDLAADQKTMFYTSEGSSVKRFDVSTGTQLSDFATGLQSPCYALRIRPNGEVMVACSNLVYRLDSAGSVMQTYPKSAYVETSFFFALNLDLDGTSFWTGGFSTGNIYKIDIATGNQLTTFTAPPRRTSMAGLAVFGEITVARPECSDGVDNDRDGKIDYPDDPGCSDPNDPDETDEITPVPEFPLAVLPVLSVLGLIFLLLRRTNK